MRKAVYRLASVVFITGFIATGGYLVYTLHYSGTKVGTYTVRELDGSVVSLPGFQLTTGRAVSHTVGPLGLSPDMNPVRVVLRFNQVGSGSAGSRLGYSFSLVDESGSTVWQHRGQHSSGSSSGSTSSTVSTPLPLINLQRPGRFVLLADFSQGGAHHPVLRKAEVTVRRNVLTPKVSMVVTLALLTVVALVGVLVTRPRG